MKKTILSSLAIASSVSFASASVWVSDTGTFEHTTATDSISATIDTAAVTFTADTAGVFKTGGTNSELTRIDENQVGNLVNYTFSSDTGINNLTLLAHNILNQPGGSTNSIGNFVVGYADGTTATIDFSTLGSVANIGSTSEFAVNGIDLEPTGLDDAFDTSSILTATTDASVYDPAGFGAGSGTYLYNSANTSNPQGSALITFGDSAANGGITDLSFTFVGNSTGGNTAFLGFSGTAVPEPSSTALLGLGGLAFILRRRR